MYPLYDIKNIVAPCGPLFFLLTFEVIKGKTFAHLQ